MLFDPTGHSVFANSFLWFGIAYKEFRFVSPEGFGLVDVLFQMLYHGNFFVLAVGKEIQRALVFANFCMFKLVHESNSASLR